MMNQETASELLSSRLWSSFCEEIDVQISGLLHKLRTCSLEEVTILQAKIATLESVKSLPKDVKEREE